MKTRTSASTLALTVLLALSSQPFTPVNAAPFPNPSLIGRRYPTLPTDIEHSMPKRGWTMPHRLPRDYDAADIQAREPHVVFPRPSQMNTGRGIDEDLDIREPEPIVLLPGMKTIKLPAGMYSLRDDLDEVEERDVDEVLEVREPDPIVLQPGMQTIKVPAGMHVLRDDLDELEERDVDEDLEVREPEPIILRPGMHPVKVLPGETIRRDGLDELEERDVDEDIEMREPIIRPQNGYYPPNVVFRDDLEGLQERDIDEDIEIREPIVLLPGMSKIATPEGTHVF